MTRPRAVAILQALFVIYVATTTVHIAYVVHHEPFAFDAWNVAAATDGAPASPGGFLAFWRDQYLWSNPRLGQALAYPAYKLDGFAELGSPIAYLAIIRRSRRPARSSTGPSRSCRSRPRRCSSCTRRRR